jgi:hypothetical protein
MGGSPIVSIAGDEPKVICAGAYEFIAWHPNSSIFAAVVDRAIELHRKTGELMSSITIATPGGTILPVECMEWSPDGTTIAAWVRDVGGKMYIRLYRVY